VRSTGSNLHAFSLQAGGRGMVGKLKNSNDILVNQRISAQVFTVAGSQTIVVLHCHHCRSNSPGTQKMISLWFILYIGASTV
jgi:hypothetical protein